MTFRHIAWQNVRRQWRDYATYLLAVTFSTVVFFVFVSLYFHPQFSGMAAASMRLQILFLVSAILVGIFSVLFLWYSSSLFFQRRHREVGTYMLMGMKKSDAAWILYVESTLVGLLALGLGTVLGLLLRRVFLLLLVRMMAMPIVLQISIDLKPIAVTVGTFVILIAATGLAGVFGVMRFQLVRLFTDRQLGEEAPRLPAIQLALAVLALVAGYGMAVCFPEASVGTDTFGLILGVTVLGTFLLFGGGFYLALRLLKQRAARRADPTAMIALGQLTFRIRRNAKFLALVAVLNAVAVASVGTFLTIREERDLMVEAAAQSIPFDFSFFVETSTDLESLVRRMGTLAPEQNPVGHFVRAYLPTPNVPDAGSPDALISLSDYRMLAAIRGLPEDLPVDAGQIALVSPGATRADSAAGFPVTAQIDALLFHPDRIGGQTVGVVLDSTLAELVTRPSDVAGESEARTVTFGVVDVARPDQSWELLELLDAELPTDADLVGYVAVLGMINGVTGALLFIGGFIGIMLILSNGSIIFFRQLMEATESRERFVLLHTLGFSMSELRFAIMRGQLVLFLVPYLIGLIHAFVALVMLSRLIDIPTLGAHVMISGVYAVVYVGFLLLNTRAYERIVFRSFASEPAISYY